MIAAEAGIVSGREKYVPEKRSRFESGRTDIYDLQPRIVDP